MTRLPALLALGIAFALLLPTAQANCAFAIRTLNLQSPVPVLNQKFIVPTGSGMIEVPTGRPLQLYCSTKFTIAPAADTITVTCVSGATFRYADTDHAITSTDLQCQSNNIKSNVQTTTPDEHRIGYSIGTSFATAIDLIFDAKLKRTVYAHHVVAPVDANAQQTVTKQFPGHFRGDKEFTTGDNDRYNFANQCTTICTGTLHLAGQAQCDHYFEADKRFLSRGHLAPSADFVYLAGKRASYSLLNVAPQWQQMNNGPWKKIEAGVRARSISTRAPLHVYTGTVGTLTLPDNGNQRQSLYLDDSAGGRIPVPEVFFKVVLDRARREGVVFLALNNPYASAADVDNAKNSVGCRDVADQLSWPAIWMAGRQRVDRDAPTFRATGYVWACEVKDFGQRMDQLPLIFRTPDYKLMN